MTKSTNTKAVNYTAEAVSTMTKMYTGKDNATEVAAIASKLNKSEASVRSKLSNLKVYVTAEKASASGQRVTKESIAEQIGAQTEMSEAEVEGLTKATKGALSKVLAGLTN